MRRTVPLGSWREVTDGSLRKDRMAAMEVIGLPTSAHLLESRPTPPPPPPFPPPPPPRAGAPPLRAPPTPASRRAVPPPASRTGGGSAPCHVDQIVVLFSLQSG